MKTLVLPGHKHVETDKIIYLESDSNYTVIHKTTTPQKIIAAKTLGHLQEHLSPESFVRINRKHIINLSKVGRVWEENDIVRIRLQDGSLFQTSRRRKMDFLRTISLSGRKLAGIVTVFVLLFCFQTVSATIRYVKPTVAQPGDGSSWEQASDDLQAMILASSSGDEVWVAGGVYYPQKNAAGNTNPADPRDKLFYMKDGVKLYGGFNGSETSLSQRNWSLNPTILSGDIDQNDLNTDGNFISENYSDIVGNNVYHVMVFAGLGVNTNTTLDGFIITGGKTTGTSPSTNQTVNSILISSFRGAALMFSAAAGQIKNCVITGNSGNAGVFYINNQNSYANLVTTFENCYWTGNQSTSVGVIYMHRSFTTFINNSVANNSAAFGGVIYTSSNMPGGSITSFNHLTAYNNTSNSSTTGPLYFEGGTVNLTNSVIRNPSASSQNIIRTGTTVTISYSNLQGSDNNGTWNSAMGTDGGNNIDAPALFSDGSNLTGPDGNYFTSDDGLTLTSCSPMINNGVSGLVTDILGNSRPFQSSADMGAYEFQSASTLPENPALITVNSTNITCGQTVSLTASCSTGTPIWFSSPTGGSDIGTGNLTVNPLNNPSRYYVSCQISETCISTKRLPTEEIQVVLPAQPFAVSASETAICPNTQVTFNATCSSATPEWYNPSGDVIGTGNSLSISVGATGTFTVKCKSGECFSTAQSVQIDVLSSPTNASVMNGAVCEGGSTGFSANCLVGNVQWHSDFSGGTLVATGSPYEFTPDHATASYYRLYPSCTNGVCTSNRSIPGSYYFFTAPTNLAVSATSLCQGNETSVTLTGSCSTGAGGSTLKWYDAPVGGNLIGSGNNLSHTPSATITYYAECVSTNYNCSTVRTATSEVKVGVPVTSPTSVSVNKTSACQGTDVILSASCSTGSVIWYNQAAGGLALGSGNNFQYAINASQTFYAACEDAACLSERQATSQVTMLPSTSGIPTQLTISSQLTGSSSQLAASQITANNKINSPANVIYHAGNAVNLQEGFETQNGTVFIAKADLIACP